MTLPPARSGARDSGQLVAVRRGVLRVAGAPACWEQSALARRARRRRRHARSRTPRPPRVWATATRFADALVEVTEPTRCSSADLAGVRTHHSTVARHRSPTCDEGIPVTSPERTVDRPVGSTRRHATSADSPTTASAGSLMTPTASPCAPRDCARRRVGGCRSCIACSSNGFPGYEPGDSDFSEHVAQVLEHVARLPGRRARASGDDRRPHVPHRRRRTLRCCSPTKPTGGTRTAPARAFYIDRARANDLVKVGLDGAPLHLRDDRRRDRCRRPKRRTTDSRARVRVVDV